MPLLLIGLGIGALASQLGAVTVSAVPDDEAPEVGGVQNTATNLGASMGTALAGSILIATLTSSFLANIEQSPAIPSQVKAQAQVELAGGVPFISDADLETALDEAGADTETSEAAIVAYQDARIDGLRSALAILALLAIVAAPQRIPKPRRYESLSLLAHWRLALENSGDPHVEPSSRRGGRRTGRGSRPPRWPSRRSRRSRGGR